MTAIHMPVLLLQDGYIVFSIYPPPRPRGWKTHLEGRQYLKDRVLRLNTEWK